MRAVCRKTYYSPLDRRVALHIAGRSYAVRDNRTDDMYTVDCERHVGHPEHIVIYKNDEDYIMVMEALIFDDW
jgi:hypothetical protein